MVARRIHGDRCPNMQCMRAGDDQARLSPDFNITSRRETHRSWFDAEVGEIPIHRGEATRTYRVKIETSLSNEVKAALTEAI